MRFLTVSPYTRGHGAYERHRRMANALCAAGHEVVWLAPGTDFASRERLVPVADGFRWAPGPLRWMLRVRATLAADPGLLDGIDAVFTVSEYDAAGVLLHPTSARLPHLFFQRGDTVACESFHAVHALTARRRWKSRLLLAWYPALQAQVLKRVSGIVVQAPFLAEALRARIPGLSCPIAVLPNDCRFEWHPERADPALVGRLAAMKAGGTLLIGLVAQAFWRGKGFDLFFDAMARLKDEPGITAAVVAYGEDENMIRATIDHMDLGDRVVWLGRVGAAHELMPQFDLVVVPTRFPDACPNVVLEAIDAGTMILASDITAHRAQLAHDGLMFPSGDGEALARRILDLRAETAAASNRVLVADRRAALGFDWDARVVALLEDFGRGRAARAA